MQFGMCTLPGARNLPYAELAGSYIGTEATPEALAVIDKWRKVDGSDKPAPLYVLCRRGIDSIRACKVRAAAHPRVASMESASLSGTGSVPPVCGVLCAVVDEGWCG